MVLRKLSALLVSDGDESLETLRAQLTAQGTAVWSSRTCTAAARLVEQTHPDLIFTTTRHADGTWRDVIVLAEKASVAASVIVVGKSDDIRLYFAAVDYGAFDLILPPFEPETISHIVRVAGENAHRHREAQAIKAVA